MSTLRTLVLASAFLISLSVVHAENGATGGTGNTSPDAQNVDNACATDAQTAGCGNEKVGTGLKRCLHAYKKSHQGFKFTPGCHAAMKQMREDRKTASGGAGK